MRVFVFSQYLSNKAKSSLYKIIRKGVGGAVKEEKEIEINYGGPQGLLGEWADQNF